LIQGSVPVTAGSSITVTVGAGGTGGQSSATDGQNSVFGSIAARGGGRGSQGVNGSQSDVSGGAYSGGSGGGAYQNSIPGNGTVGQGNRGGNNGGGSPSSTAGGGGGAGTIGLNTLANYVGANGGAGIASAISGTVTTYAGGGAGGGYQSVGVGGVGGGGNAGFAGTTNTGGGGGGYRQDPGNLDGGAGGSGIVIVSYPDVYAAAASTIGSPTVSTSGSGSWYYPNSIAKVTYSSSYNSAWSFGTGDFTVEGYCYLASGSSSTIPMFDARSGASATPWVLNVGTSTNQTYFYNGTLFYSSINIAYNTWNHIAVTRQSGTLKIWINGAQGYTGTVTANLDATGPLNIGDVIQTGQNWLGYLSNMRIVKGTSLYNSAFTPSTIPLTAVSGTTFLNGAISGSPYLDFSTTNAQPNSGTTLPAWNQLSPFATGIGNQNRVYTWTRSGTLTF
jgi:hypothetical protein